MCLRAIARAHRRGPAPCTQVMQIVGRGGKRIFYRHIGGGNCPEITFAIFQLQVFVDVFFFHAAHVLFPQLLACDTYQISILPDGIELYLVIDIHGHLSIQLCHLIIGRHIPRFDGQVYAG